MSEKVKEYSDKMQKTLDHLQSEYAAVRAGRANPHVLDKIRVDYYGTPTPIQQVGNVSVPDPRIIQIQPWEKGILKDIEKAIQASDIGINPTNDGTVIRLVFPELTEERRKSLVKDVKKKGEDVLQLELADVFAAAKNGDAQVAEIVDRAASALAMALKSVIYLVDPAKIALYGQLLSLAPAGRDAGGCGRRTRGQRGKKPF